MISRVANHRCPRCDMGQPLINMWINRSFWICKTCGTVLRISKRPRIWLFFIILTIAVIPLIYDHPLLRHIGFYPWFFLIPLIGLLVSIFALSFIDKVIVANDLDPNTCTRCGYDIRTSQSLNRSQCPECGLPLKQQHVDNVKPSSEAELTLQDNR